MGDEGVEELDRTGFVGDLRDLLELGVSGREDGFDGGTSYVEPSRGSASCPRETAERAHL